MYQILSAAHIQYVYIYILILICMLIYVTIYNEFYCVYTHIYIYIHTYMDTEQNLLQQPQLHFSWFSRPLHKDFKVCESLPPILTSASVRHDVFFQWAIPIFPIRSCKSEIYHTRTRPEYQLKPEPENGRTCHLGPFDQYKVGQHD